jgi:hypothetical protein
VLLLLLLLLLVQCGSCAGDLRAIIRTCTARAGANQQGGSGQGMVSALAQ